MDAMITARIDEDIKERALAIIKEKGYSTSSAIQRFFEYIVKHDALPFDDEQRPSREEIQKRIQAFDACHTKQPLTLTDAEIKQARLRERYGFDD